MEPRSQTSNMESQVVLTFGQQPAMNTGLVAPLGATDGKLLELRLQLRRYAWGWRSPTPPGWADGR